MKIKPKELMELINSNTDPDRTIEDIDDTITVYDLIVQDAKLQELFGSLLDFFFIEKVVFYNGLFVLFDKDADLSKIDESDISSVRGVINKTSFEFVIECIQQICCIYEPENKDKKEPKFKNALAKRMYEKMEKARKEQEQRKLKEQNKDFALSNIISKVSNRHPSINPINVWDLTIFQLIDSFNCMRVNTVYDIESTRTAVWGDEKKTFDISLWYKSKETDENKI